MMHRIITHTAPHRTAARRICKSLRPSICSNNTLIGHEPTSSSRNFSAEPSPNNNTNNTTTIRHQRPIYVAATKQHVGKTSVSLALVSHFTKRFGSANVGYMKAVGQQCLRVWDEPPDGGEGQYVTIDKDVK